MIGLTRFEKLFMAVAFAEEKEFDTARDIIGKEDRPQKIDRSQPTDRMRKELRAPGMDR